MHSDSTLVVLAAFVIGGFVAQAIESYFTIAASLTALMAFVGRSTAVLMDLPRKRIDRLTAIGAFFGVVVAAAVIVADLVAGS